MHRSEFSQQHPQSLEVSTSTPLTEESTENACPQVNQNYILDETNEIPAHVENITNEYPQRSNRRVPRKQYEPDPNTKTKYSMSNYMSSHRLSKSYAFSVNQLSIVSIPSNI